MKSNLKNWCGVIAAVILIVGLVAGSVSQVYAKANPGVIPPNAHAHGMTYGEWSAEWWKWQFRLPATDHPAFSLTGANCGAGQAGPVWFLTGAFTNEFPGNQFFTIVRESCSVPAGTALFFPIINNECSTLEDDPWQLIPDNPDNCAAKFFDGRVGVVQDLSLTIDGRLLANVEAFRKQSPVFQFTLPNDNILGVDCNTADCVNPQSVSDGYWVMLSPLSVGEHTIRFTGSFRDPNNNDPNTNLIFGLDVTYVLTVVPVHGKNCTTRPLSDFLDAQGTLNDPPQFFPPVKDYVGWVDGKFITFALVDYAGLADEYITDRTGNSLGTKVKGTVLQCELADGRAEITVALSTTKALGFAQSIAALAANDFDFLNTPTIFGAKAQDVVNGAAAATGPASLFTTFSISAPGAPLPDFLDVVNNPATYAPVKLSFMSTTCGTDPNGRKARLDVHEMASTNRANELVYSVEHVKVIRAQGGNCGD